MWKSNGGSRTAKATVEEISGIDKVLYDAASTNETGLVITYQGQNDRLKAAR